MTTTFADHAIVQNFSGNDFLQYTSSTGSVLFHVDKNGAVFTPGTQETVVLLSGTADALSAHGRVNYVVTKAGTDAMTLAAPTAGTDDGAILTVTSATANAHTITATGLINNGTTGGPHNTATFAAFSGASITLMAYNALWYVLGSVNVTIS